MAPNPRISVICLCTLAIGVPLAFIYWQYIRRWRLRKMAIFVFQCLNDTGMPYWVDFGTLLGIHREGDIILGDNDVDVCILDPKEESLHDLGHRVHKAGYIFRYRVFANISRVYDRWWPWGFVDLYHVRRSQDGSVYHGATGVTSDIPVHLIDCTQTHHWHRGGVDVVVPADVHGVLEWRYGDDYMTPKPGFKGRNS